MYGYPSVVFKERNEFFIQNGSTKYFIWRYQVWRWFEDAEDLPHCSKYRPIYYPYHIPVSDFSKFLTMDEIDRHDPALAGE